MGESGGVIDSGELARCSDSGCEDIDWVPVGCAKESGCETSIGDSGRTDPLDGCNACMGETGGAMDSGEDVRCSDSGSDETDVLGDGTREDWIDENGDTAVESVRIVATDSIHSSNEDPHSTDVSDEEEDDDSLMTCSCLE